MSTEILVLGKLIFAQIVKLPVFYGTLRFLTVFITNPLKPELGPYKIRDRLIHFSLSLSLSVCFSEGYGILFNRCDSTVDVHDYHNLGHLLRVTFCSLTLATK